MVAAQSLWDWLESDCRDVLSRHNSSQHSGRLRPRDLARFGKSCSTWHVHNVRNLGGSGRTWRQRLRGSDQGQSASFFCGSHNVRCRLSSDPCRTCWPTKQCTKWLCLHGHPWLRALSSLCGGSHHDIRAITGDDTGPWKHRFLDVRCGFDWISRIRCGHAPSRFSIQCCRLPSVLHFGLLADVRSVSNLSGTKFPIFRDSMRKSIADHSRGGRRVSSSLAAVFSGVSGQMELREISRPEPSSGEILVRVLGCTLCGSDLHTFEGRRQVPTPTVLGHEVTGEIVALGPDAPRCDLAGQELRCGNRITWSLVASCGQCVFCQHDLPQKCVKAVKYGHEPLRPGRELLGGLAEHCLLVPGTSIVRLPDDFPLEVACPANCATATAAAALEAVGEIQGTRVLVLGAGLLGLTVCAMARTRRAAEVICVEVNSERRTRARLFGA